MSYYTHVHINSYVTQFNLDQPSDDIDTVLRQIAKRIGALMKGDVPYNYELIYVVHMNCIIVL